MFQIDANKNSKAEGNWHGNGIILASQGGRCFPGETSKRILKKP